MEAEVTYQTESTVSICFEVRSSLPRSAACARHLALVGGGCGVCQVLQAVRSLLGARCRLQWRWRAATARFGPCPVPCTKEAHFGRGTSPAPRWTLGRRAHARDPGDCARPHFGASGALRLRQGVARRCRLGILPPVSSWRAGSAWHRLQGFECV